jgi:hypothetical protein
MNRNQSIVIGVKGIFFGSRENISETISRIAVIWARGRL